MAATLKPLPTIQNWPIPQQPRRRVARNATHYHLRINQRASTVAVLAVHKPREQSRSGGLPRYCTEQRSAVSLEVAIVKLGYSPQDFINWKVVRGRSKGGQLGRVQDVVVNTPNQRQTAGKRRLPVNSLLKVVCPEKLPPYEYEGEVVHYIPLVPEVVPTVIPNVKVLLVTPPEGLLELGRRQLILGILGRELKPYCLPPEGVSADWAAAIPHTMPSKRLLLEQGRGDLVDLVMRAGGVAQVANALGMQAPTRPHGYWDSLETLDAELALFVASMWLKLPINDEDMAHPMQLTLPAADVAIESSSGSEGGAGGGGGSVGSTRSATEYYFYNLVSRRMLMREPSVLRHMRQLAGGGGAGPPTTQQLLELVSRQEVQQDRVMPSKSELVGARRWDLHHAIQAHGGYRAASTALDRRPSWPSLPDALATDLPLLALELRSVAAGLGLPPDTLPTRSQLQKCGRSDLASLVRHHGGVGQVSRLTGLKSRRSPRRTFDQLHELTAALKAFMEQEGLSDIPTVALLRTKRRFDLVWGLTKHRHSEVVQVLGLEARQQGTAGRGKLPPSMVEQALKELLMTHPPAATTAASTSSLATSTTPRTVAATAPAPAPTPSQSPTPPASAHKGAGGGGGGGAATMKGEGVGGVSELLRRWLKVRGGVSVSASYCRRLVSNAVEMGLISRVARGRYTLVQDDELMPPLPSLKRSEP